MNEIIESIIGIIESAITLKNDEKEAYIEMLRAGEPFPEDFIADLDSVLAREDAYLKMEEERLGEELKKADAELDEARTASLPEKRKFIEEYRGALRKIYENYTRESEAIMVNYEKEVEKIVHEKAEGAEVDAIHQFLKKPKKNP